MQDLVGSKIINRERARWGVERGVGRPLEKLEI